MTLSPIIYNRGLMFVRWTHAARSLLFVFAVPAFLAALSTRPARGAGADASALWEAWPHTVEVSPFALKHEELRARLAAIAARYPGLFSIVEEGVSAEGRDIPLLVVGGGPTTVLLWSQMHGDEPTATSALLDILEYLGRTQKTPDTERLVSRLTLAIIPMLNPDGAARARARGPKRAGRRRHRRPAAPPAARGAVSQVRARPAEALRRVQPAQPQPERDGGEERPAGRDFASFRSVRRRVHRERRAPDDHADGRPRPAASRTAGGGSRGPL